MWLIHVVHIGGFLGCMDLIMHVVDISFGMNWRFCEVCGDNWCLEGDFNVVRLLHEKFNSSRFTRSMRMFNDLIGEMSLIDPPLANSRYTWSNFRDNPICYRLDRFLFSRG